PNFLCRLSKENGNAYDQMKAAVAVGLRVLNIILFPDQPDIILFGQGICQKINIVNIGAYHSDSSNIIQTVLYVFPCRRQPHLCHLLQNARLTFQTGLDRTDRVPFISDLEFGIQDLKLCIDLLDRTGISHHKFLIVQNTIQQIHGMPHDDILSDFFRHLKPVFFFHSYLRSGSILSVSVFYHYFNGWKAKAQLKYSKKILTMIIPMEPL